MNRFASARQEISQWLKEGSIKRRFHVVQGLQNAPQSLNLLFNGGNTGKLYVLRWQHAGFRTDMRHRVVQVAATPAKL